MTIILLYLAQLLEESKLNIVSKFLINIAKSAEIKMLQADSYLNTNSKGKYYLVESHSLIYLISPYLKLSFDI